MILEEYERTIQGLIESTLNTSPEIQHWKEELKRLAGQDGEQYLPAAMKCFDILYRKMFFGENGRIRKDAEQYLGAASQYVDDLCIKLHMERDFVVGQILIPRVMKNVRHVVPMYIIPGRRYTRIA